MRRRPLASVRVPDGGPDEGNSDIQVSVSKTAVSGRTNLSETASCRSTVPRNIPLKISLYLSRNSLI
jgi:uncharacterized membrane protein